jgi:hypothetical protein
MRARQNVKLLRFFPYISLSLFCLFCPFLWNKVLTLNVVTRGSSDAGSRKSDFPRCNPDPDIFTLA